MSGRHRADWSALDSELRFSLRVCLAIVDKLPPCEIDGYIRDRLGGCGFDPR